MKIRQHCLHIYSRKGRWRILLTSHFVKKAVTVHASNLLILGCRIERPQKPMLIVVWIQSTRNPTLVLQFPVGFVSARNFHMRTTAARFPERDISTCQCKGLGSRWNYICAARHIETEPLWGAAISSIKSCG